MFLFHHSPQKTPAPPLETRITLTALVKVQVSKLLRSQFEFCVDKCGPVYPFWFPGNKHSVRPELSSLVPGHQSASAAPHLATSKCYLLGLNVILLLLEVPLGGAPPPHFCSERFRFQRVLEDPIPSNIP